MAFQKLNQIGTKFKVMRAKSVKKKYNTIAIDFDGVIHSYNRGWTGDVPTDPPIFGVEKALEKLKDMGWKLVIMSTRKPEFIKPWLKEYGLDKYIDDITDQKIPAKIYIDDRGYRFERWDDTLEFMKDFKD